MPAAGENKRKHLDLLQSAISRMAGNSFALKGWSVALATVIFGLSTKESVPGLALVALVPILAFWGLDAYYLALERGFRALYTAAILPNTPTDFAMKPSAVTPKVWLECARRPAVVWLHLPLAGAAVAVFLALSRPCIW